MTAIEIKRVAERLAARNVQPLIYDDTNTFEPPKGWRSMTAEELQLGAANAAYLFNDMPVPVRIFIYKISVFVPKRKSLDQDPPVGRATVRFYVTSGNAERYGDEFELQRYTEPFDRSFLVEDTSTDKPKLEDVFTAFQEFQNTSRRAVTQPEAMATAVTELREKLECMGLADQIDWPN